MKCNVLIPMAGEGSRFKDAGFSTPKPFIEVDGEPMIYRVYKNLKPERSHRFIFICRSEHVREMRRIFKKEKVTIITVDKPTKGALCTTLFARDFIDNKTPLIIGACDQLVDIDINDFLSNCENTDGCLMTYNSDKDNHSFSRVEDGVVVETAEKRVISNNANVGIYYFGSGEDYCEAAEKMLDYKDTYNNEYYIAPAYNHLVGRNIIIYEIHPTAAHNIGTPYELRQYRNRSGKLPEKLIEGKRY